MIYAGSLLAFFVSLLLLIFTVLILYLTSKKKNQKIIFWSLNGLKNQNIYKFLKGTRILLFTLCFVYLILSLARPQEKKPYSKKSQKGIDILFVLDISDSMLIEDMKPLENRLESAKHHIKEFIKNRPNDRLGLVVFSGEAYTRIPLTTDHGLLLNNMDGIQISETIKKGTAIGVALASGVNRLRSSNSKSKVLVLLTDGENNAGVIDPLTALDLAVDEDIKCYTLGIGKDGQSMLPIFRKDRYGRKIKSYRPFPTKINEELLRRIAFETSGQFFRASDESDMSRIFSSIDKLEKSEVKTPKTYRMIEHFQSSLMISLIFAVLFFLSEILFFWRRY